MITFNLYGKVFYETLETMTIEFWLLHRLNIKIEGNAKCEGDQMLVNFYKKNGEKKIYFTWNATFQVLRAIKKDSVTVESEGKLFRVTAVKEVPQWWRYLPGDSED